MKYAIVEISGRQFWIETGKYYDFNRIPTDLGKQITLNRVLLLNNEGDVLVGKPYLESVKLKENFRTFTRKKNNCL
jgi:large subunit ribosomal protein L21